MQTGVEARSLGRASLSCKGCTLLRPKISLYSTNVAAHKDVFSKVKVEGIEEAEKYRRRALTERPLAGNRKMGLPDVCARARRCMGVGDELMVGGLTHTYLSWKKYVAKYHTCFVTGFGAPRTCVCVCVCVCACVLGHLKTAEVTACRTIR